MSSMKRQVKHLTKEALDPTRCFSIVLDQVRTIYFRLDERTTDFSKNSHPQSTSLWRQFLSVWMKQRFLGVFSPAEHVSRKLSCRQSRRTVPSTLNVPTMKHGTTGIIRFWSWPIVRIASKILHDRSNFTISNNFKVKALKKEDRMRTMLKGPEKFLEDAFNRADKRLELHYLTDSGLLFFF